MTIKSIQKIIKVGSSQAVTLPARDLRAVGLKAGDEVEISVKAVASQPSQPPSQITKEYQIFKAQYAETLKNLSDR